MKPAPLTCPLWTKESAALCWFGMKLDPMEPFHNESSPSSLTFTEYLLYTEPVISAF